MINIDKLVFITNLVIMESYYVFYLLSEELNRYIYNFI